MIDKTNPDIFGPMGEPASSFYYRYRTSLGIFDPIIYMSLPYIFALSLTEIVGDVALKQYANDKGVGYLSIGVAGYIGVVILLIINLQGSSILLVNNGWDGMNSLLGSLFAYFILGERFENYLQYFGVVFIILGLYLLKIPLSKKHPFHIPK